MATFLRGDIADQLRAIVNSKLRGAEATSRDFSANDWAAKAAYNMGRIDVCKELLALLDPQTTNSTK